MNTPYDTFQVENQRNKETQLIEVGQYCYFPQLVLGHGSFGSVFRAKQIKNNNEVAIKVIQHKRMTTTFQKVLLENEKRVVRTLIGQNIESIVQYFEIIETSTHTYIVMEFCSNGDLESIKPTISCIKQFAMMLSKGLIELNRLNIVHRDLKPSNILIDNSGKLKIIDFGFAVIQEQPLKCYNYCIGSPVYCAPESLLKGQYGLRSDLWALGVILFKLINGKTPWKGKNNKQLSLNMQTNPITKIAQLQPDKFLSNLIKSLCTIQGSYRMSIEQFKQIYKKLFYQLANGNNQQYNLNLYLGIMFDCDSNSEQSTGINAVSPLR